PRGSGADGAAARPGRVRPLAGRVRARARRGAAGGALRPGRRLRLHRRPGRPPPRAQRQPRVVLAAPRRGPPRGRSAPPHRLRAALAAMRRHAAAAVPHVVGDDYMVEHWLAAYAVLLLT